MAVVARAEARLHSGGNVAAKQADMFFRQTKLDKRRRHRQSVTDLVDSNVRRTFLPCVLALPSMLQHKAIRRAAMRSGAIPRTREHIRIDTNRIHGCISSQEVGHDGPAANGRYVGPRLGRQDCLAGQRRCLCHGNLGHGLARHYVLPAAKHAALAPATGRSDERVSWRGRRRQQERTT